MNEAHSGIELGSPLIFLKSLVIFARIGEVVNGSDSVNEVVEGAFQGEPVIIFGPGPLLPGFQCFHPARHGGVLVDILVCSQAAKSALRQMTVRRNEARENEFSFGVVGGLRLRARGWVALADGFDLSVVAHQDVADERLRLPGFHGHVRTVDDEQLICSEYSVRTQQNSQESCTNRAPATGKDHFLGSSFISSRGHSAARARGYRGLCDWFASRGYRVPLLPPESPASRTSILCDTWLVAVKWKGAPDPSATLLMTRFRAVTVRRRQIGWTARKAAEGLGSHTQCRLVSLLRQRRASGRGPGGGLPNDKFRFHDHLWSVRRLGMVDSIQQCFGARLTHGPEGLADGGEAGNAEGRAEHVVEADHGNVLRHLEPGFVQGADGAEGSDIVECKERGEIPGTRQQRLYRAVPQGGGPTILGQLYQQFLVNLQPESAGCFHNLPPAMVRVDRLLLTFHERNSAVSQVCKVLECEISGLLVVQLDISYSVNILVA